VLGLSARARALTSLGGRIGASDRRRPSGPPPAVDGARTAVSGTAAVGDLGPAEFRDGFLRSLDGGGFRLTVVRPPSVGDGEPRAAFGRLGWQVTELSEADAEAGASVDAAVIETSEFDIRRLADGVISIAWVGDDPEAWLSRPWFDEFDLVLARDDSAKTAIDAHSVHDAQVRPGRGNGSIDDAGAVFVQERLRAWATAPRFDIAIGPPSWDAAASWGDYHFGRALQRALQHRGYPARIRLRPAWASRTAGRADAAIHIFGLKERPVYPGQVSVLWIISHPDLVTDEMVARYDVVFAASDRFAGDLAERTGRAVQPLHQATDPTRFRPGLDGPAHELLFVANSRGVRRPVVDELTPTARDLAVYGRSWTTDLLDPRHLRGERVPNEELAGYYAAADIVLNDHWADMAEYGFLSNRLYDASAAGAFVISDRVPGMDAEFDGGIVSFEDGPELRDLVERYLADPATRAEHARRARAAVLAAHTFDHRAGEILRHVEPLLTIRRDS
jgi:hypothetical protein